MMMTDYPPLSEAKVQAGKARHVAVDTGFDADSYFCQEDYLLWPCPTIRLIAERERLKAVSIRAKAVDHSWTAISSSTPLQIGETVVGKRLALALVDLRVALAETGGER